MSIVEKAVQAVMGLMPDKAPDPLIDAHRVITQPLARVDGPLKVTGKARFAAEVEFDHPTYAALVYSTIPRGRIASIETAVANAAPGVLLVMTHENAPRLPPALLIMVDPKGAAGSNLPVMQDASIHWNGEPVAVVIAETQEQADHAASLVRVRYDPEQAATAFDLMKAYAKSPGDVVREPPRVTVGDAEAALAPRRHHRLGRRRAHRP